MAGFEYRYRGARTPPESRGGKPPAYNKTVQNEHAMIIERDVVVTMRDGGEALCRRIPPRR